MIFDKILTSHRFNLLLLLILFVTTIPSCTSSNITETASTIPSSVPTLPTPSATLAATPIQTKILFLDSDQTSKTISQSISSTLFELAQSHGYEFISSTERPLQEFNPGIQVVVAVPPDPGLQTIANEHPDIQFISIGISNLQPSPNLSIIGPQGFREDRIAFIAGYIATVLTKDWRVGMIYQASPEWIDLIHQSFTNGLVYYCGICQLTYPPYYDYPTLTFLSETASAIDWQNSADLLISQAVETVFVYSNEFDTPTLEYLSQNDMNFLGVNSRPESLESYWIATIRIAPERIIESHWNDVVSHSGGWIEEIPIIVEDVNEDLFSLGKLQWVQEFINDVLGGYIETGVDFTPGSE